MKAKTDRFPICPECGAEEYEFLGTSRLEVDMTNERDETDTSTLLILTECFDCELQYVTEWKFLENSEYRIGDFDIPSSNGVSGWKKWQ